MAITDEHAENGWNVCRLKQRVGLPGIIPLLCDEFLHHLRGALDYLVCAMVEPQSAISDQHGFPCLRSNPNGRFLRDGYETGRYTAFIPDEARALIDGFQPYLGTEPDGEFLAGLDKLGNLFKHQSPIQIGCKIWFPKLAGGIYPPYDQILDDGDVIALLPPQYDPKIDFAEKTVVEIFFKFAGWGPVDLRPIYEFVRDGVIPSFSRFYPAR